MISDNYLENKTFSSLKNEIKNVLSFITIQSIHDDLVIKLKHYRFVDEIYQLHTGKHTRWLYKTDHFLKVGGIVTAIKFLDNGTHILLYNSNQKRFVQIKFDNVFLFQKLTMEEEIILYAQNNINKNI